MNLHLDNQLCNLVALIILLLLWQLIKFLKRDSGRGWITSNISIWLAVEGGKIKTIHHGCNPRLSTVESYLSVVRLFDMKYVHSASKKKTCIEKGPSALVVFGLRHIILNCCNDKTKIRKNLFSCPSVSHRMCSLTALLHTWSDLAVLTA